MSSSSTRCRTRPRIASPSSGSRKTRRCSNVPSIANEQDRRHCDGGGSTGRRGPWFGCQPAVCQHAPRVFERSIFEVAQPVATQRNLDDEENSECKRKLQRRPDVAPPAETPPIEQRRADE